MDLRAHLAAGVARLPERMPPEWLTLVAGGRTGGLPWALAAVRSGVRYFVREVGPSGAPSPRPCTALAAADTLRAAASSVACVALPRGAPCVLAALGRALAIAARRLGSWAPTAKTDIGEKVLARLRAG